MKITVDTNMLVRSIVRDDEKQALAAEKALRQATVDAVALPTLCEFVWVLRKVYGITAADVATAIRPLLSCETLAGWRSTRGQSKPTEARGSGVEAGGSRAT